MENANGIYISIYTPGSSGGANTPAGKYNRIINNILNSYISNPDDRNYAISVMDSYNIITGNKINGANRGINSEGENLIESNTIENLKGNMGILTGTSSNVTKNTIKGDGAGIVANSNSYIYYNTIDVSQEGIGIMGENIKIDNNIIESQNKNSIDLSYFSTRSSNAMVTNNILKSPNEITDSSYPIKGVLFENNTIKTSSSYALILYGSGVEVKYNQIESLNKKGDNAVYSQEIVNSNTGIIRETHFQTTDIETRAKSPNIVVKILDSENNPVPMGVITLSINSNIFNQTVTDGSANFKLENLNAGEYILNLNYISNEIEYLNSTGSLKLKILEQETVIPVTPVNPQENITENITGNITENITENVTENITENIIENVTENISENITENNTITVTIDSQDLTKIYGSEDSFKGKLLDGEKPIIGHHINLKLTRTSNGQSKTYDIVTDYNGEFNLPINLAKGVYSCEINYTGLELNNKNYTSAYAKNLINVQTEASNKTITILETERFNEKYGAGESFKGTLKDNQGNILAGHHVSVKLTRVSSGASKTYDTVCDYTGTFKLEINLAVGEYTVQCTYAGTNMYQESTSFNTLTITN